MEKVKSFIAETNDLIGSIKKFSIEDEFFKYRVDQFNELKTLLKDCPKALQELEKEEKKFAEKVLSPPPCEFKNQCSGHFTKFSNCDGLITTSSFARSASGSKVESGSNPYQVSG